MNGLPAPAPAEDVQLDADAVAFALTDPRIGEPPVLHGGHGSRVGFSPPKASPIGAGSFDWSWLVMLLWCVLAAVAYTHLGGCAIPAKTDGGAASAERTGTRTSVTTPDGTTITHEDNGERSTATQPANPDTPAVATTSTNAASTGASHGVDQGLAQLSPMTWAGTALAVLGIVGMFVVPATLVPRRAMLGVAAGGAALAVLPLFFDRYSGHIAAGVLLVLVGLGAWLVARHRYAVKQLVGGVENALAAVDEPTREKLKGKLAEKQDEDVKRLVRTARGKTA